MGDIKYDVFISYSRKDFDEVNAIRQMLADQLPGLKVWFDIDGIESGDEFEEKIISAIDNSRYVLFALSDNSIQSIWTKDEVMYAKNTDKKVIPLLLKGAKMKGWFLFRFGRIDCIDTTDSRQMHKLIANLKAWCELAETAQSIGSTLQVHEPTNKVYEDDKAAEGHTKPSEPAKRKTKKETAAKTKPQYKKLAEAGDVASMEALADIYRQEQKYPSAIMWYIKAIESKSTYARQQYLNLYRGEAAAVILKNKTPDIIDEITAAAAVGYGSLMFTLGKAYDEGCFCTRKDNVQTALLHYLEAEREGHPEATANVARLQARGINRDQDADGYEKRLIKLFEETNDHWWAYYLGKLYHFGRGEIKPDFKKALYWYSRSYEIDKSLEYTPYNIGMLYQHGVCGVGRDIDKAISWYKIAAQNAYDDSHILEILKELGVH